LRVSEKRARAAGMVSFICSSTDFDYPRSARETSCAAIGELT
jgi:hypothetical protein